MPSINCKNILLLTVLFLCTAIMTSNDAIAIQYISKEIFTRQNIPKESRLKEKTIYLDNNEKQRLTYRLNISEVPDSVPFIIGRNREDALTGAVCFLKVYGDIHREYHHVGVALNPDGTIKTVEIIELYSKNPQRVAKETFLGQFAEKSADRLRYGEDISAVAGATESSRTVLRAVKVIVALFLEFIKE